jgi:hypothetical protein
LVSKLKFEDIPPLDNIDFKKVVNEIGTDHVKFGQMLMNHMIDCEPCRNKSIELQKQALKHIEELAKLT